MAQSIDALTIKAQTIAEPAGWFFAEPALRDMLDDPITQLLMKRDGTDACSILALVAAQRSSLHAQGRLGAGGIGAGSPKISHGFEVAQFAD